MSTRFLPEDPRITETTCHEGQALFVLTVLDEQGRTVFFDGRTRAEVADRMTAFFAQAELPEDSDDGSFEAEIRSGFYGGDRILVRDGADDETDEDIRRSEMRAELTNERVMSGFRDY